MKKKILLGLLCCILIVAGILGGALAASAAEAKTITDNMDAIQQQLVAEEISLEQYTQSVRSLNQVLESKKLEEVYATVTYDQEIPVEEAYRMADEQSVQLERLEIRFYHGDEPFTAYIRNLGEEETMAQVARIAQENEFSFSGVISTNITLPSQKLSSLEAQSGVYCVDASADNYLEDRSATQPERRETFRKSLAWELGN